MATIYKQRTLLVLLAVFLCLVLLVGAVSASYSISNGTISNTNVKGSSSQYNVGPSGTSGVTVTNVTNTAGLYLSASGVTLTESESGTTVTFTKTISSQMGSSVTHSDSTNLINGGYSYGDGTYGANDVHTYSDTTQRTATYTVANDIQSLSLTASTTVFLPKAPTITAVSISPTEGGTSTSYTASVTATSSSGSMSYQWYQSTNSGSSWTAISGATSASSTITLSATGTYKFKVIVTDSAGSADSYTEGFTSVTATVYSPPTVTVSASKSEGALSTSVTVTATASGQGTLTYQWQQSTDGSTYTNVSGATSTTYTATISDSSATTHYYRVLVTGTGGTTTSTAVTYHSNARPVISAVSATPTAGGLSKTVTLSATATGSGTLSYQWYEGSSALSGKTSASVSVNVSDSSATTHTYYVVVTDGYSQSTTSSDVTYTSQNPPVISAVTASPTTGALTQNVTLSTTATGSGTLSYQWYEGSSVISGATTASYTASVSDSSATTHTYHVVVTDSNGQSTTSSNVTYTSNNMPTVSVSANKTDGALSSSVTLTATATGTSVTYQWYEGSSAISGATSSTYTANLSDSTGTTHTYHVVVTDAYSQTATSSNVTYTTHSLPTVTATANPTIGALSSTFTLSATATGDGTLSYQWYEGSSALSGKISATESITISDSVPTLHTYHVTVTDIYGQTATSSDVTYDTHSPPEVTISANKTDGALTSSVELTATATGEGTLSYQWYEGSSAITGATTASYTASVSDSSATTHTYHVVVSDTYGQTTVSDNLTYETHNAPTVSAVSATPSDGALSSTVTLSVTASGSNITYQWYEGSSALSGKTSAVVSVDVSDSSSTLHTYKAVVTDEYGQSTTSSNVTYTTYNAPTVTASIDKTEGALSTSVTLTATATSVTNLSYQWYENDSAIVGATSSTYTATISDVSATTHTYKVIATDTYGQSTTSNNVTYSSVNVPVISSVSASPTEGRLQNTITLTTSATGSGTLTYQWYDGTSAITGATSATSTDNVNDSSATVHSYHVVVTDQYSQTATSDNVTYNSYPAPTITVTADKTDGALISTVSLTASATGQGISSYQWYENGSAIAGATRTTYTATLNDTAGTAHEYYLVATGTGGTTTSNSVTYTTHDFPTVTASIDKTEGGLNATVSLSSTSSPNVTYQWYDGTNPITGATLSSYNATITDSVSSTHIFHVVATDIYGQGTASNDVTYTSVSIPVITAVTINPSEGGLSETVTLSVTASGSGTLSYQWYEGSTAITGKTSATETVTISDSSATIHTYYAVVKDQYNQISASDHVTYNSYSAPNVTVSANKTDGALTSSVELTASATGQGTLTYQWYEGTEALIGATSSSYTANIYDSVGTAHVYTVQVTGTGGTTTSNSVTYTTHDIPTAPTVTATPSSGALTSTVILTATGSSGVSYQWYEGSTALSGKTSATVTVDVTDSSATTHTYHAVVTDAYGQTATSLNVTYSTVDIPVISSVTASPTEGGLQNTVTLSVTASGSSLSYQWYEGTTALSGKTSDSVTVTINDSSATTHTYHVVVKDEYNQTATSTDVTYSSVSIPTISSVSATPTEGGLNGTFALSVTATGSNLSYQWYEGSSAIAGATTATYNVTVSDSSATTHTYHAVVTDEYNQSVTSDNVTYKSYNAPTISSVTSTPQIGGLQNTVNLSVTATGHTSLTYQWYEGTTGIIGATSATYQATISDSSATVHTYHVVVTDAYGQSTTSSNVVYESQDVSAVTVTIDTTDGALHNFVTLTATAERAGTYTYKWYESTDGSTYEELVGKTSATITVETNDSSATTHRFYALLTDEYSQMAQSNIVIYQSYNKPVVATPSVTPTAGGLDNTITLSVTATGQGTLVYKWYEGTDEIGEGATYEHHVTDSTATVHTYRAEVTDMYNQVTASSHVTYNSYPAPTVSLTSDKTDGALSSSVTLTATASGQGISSYHWYEGSSVISGATSSTYTANISDSVGTAHVYSVVVTGTGGSTTSNSVIYTTHDFPTVTATVSSSEGALSNSITLTASGSSGVTYQWYEGSSAIEGATSATYNATISDSSATLHTYKVIVTDAYGQTTTSNNVTYQSYERPVISSVSAIPTEGGLQNTVQLSVTATGAGTLSYQWYEGSSSISGKTSASESVTINDSTATVHTYHVIVTDVYNQTTTSDDVTYNSYPAPTVSLTSDKTDGALSSSVTLTATASGQGISSYQWYEGETLISGATSSSYTATISDSIGTAHTYKVVVTGTGGSTTSNTVTYTTHDIPVISAISATPSSGKLVQDVSLSVTATGSNVSYQWYEGTTELTDKTSATVTVSVNDSSATLHTYKVVVTDVYSQTANQTVTYQSNNVPVISSVSASPTEGGLQNTVTLTVNATGSNVTYQWYEGTSALSGKTSAVVSVDVSDSSSTLHTYHAVVTDEFGQAVSSNDVTYQSYTAPTVTVTSDKTNGALVSSVTLTATATSEIPETYQWYENDSVISGATSSTYTANISDVSGTTHTYYVVVTNTGGSTESNHVTYTTHDIPVISAISASPSEGGLTASVTLSATATGSNIAYEWKEGGNTIGTSATVHVNVSDSSATLHTYTLTVIDVYDQTATQTVTYQSYGFPIVSSITANPTEGGLSNSVTLSVTATGQGTLSYQWYEGSSALSGKTSASETLTITDSTATVHTYHVVVTDSYNQSTTSTDVTYQSYNYPTVTPTISAIEGALVNEVTMSVTAEGQSPFTYQWQVFTLEWTTLGGETSSSYTASINDTSATEHKYRVLVTDKFNQTTTSTVLTYNSVNKPVITSVTTNPTEGKLEETVDLSVSATGTGTLTYQWYEGTSVLTGKTSQYEEVTISDSEGRTHEYHVNVTDIYGQTTISDNATFRSYGAPEISAISASTNSGALVNTVNLSVTATGAETLTYEWYDGETKLGNGTTYEVHINDSTGTLHEFHVVITDRFGQTTTSQSVTYQSYSYPTVTPSISALEGALVSTPTLTAVTTSESGQNPLSYQWYEGTTEISGATSSSYQVSVSDESARKHTYHVVVTDRFGQSTTSSDVEYQTVNKPTISAVSVTPTEGSVNRDVVLSVTASGSGMLSYQWYEGSSSITSWLYNTTYTHPINDVSDTEHVFYVIVKDQYNQTTTSTNVTYNSYLPPVITNIAISSQEGKLQSSATLSATASGHNITAHWQENRDGTWSEIGTGLSYTVNVRDSIETLHTYRLVVTDSIGQSTTSASTVTYQTIGLPTAGTATVNPTVGLHTQSITLTGNSSGLGTLTYQWQKSTDGSTWSDLAGATQKVYTGTQTISGNKIYYRLATTNIAGTVYSTSCQYETYPEPTVTVSADKENVQIGTSVTLTATTQYVQSLVWKQSYDGTSWTDIGTTSVVSKVLSTSGTTYFKCVVTGMEGTVIESSTLSVFVGNVPTATIVKPSSGSSYAVGAPISFEGIVSSDTTRYWWDFDGEYTIKSGTSGLTPTIYYSSGGSHHVTLNVENIFGTGTVYVDITSTTSIRPSATSTVDKVEEYAGKSILEYTSAVVTPNEDGMPDILALFVDALNPYKSVIGAWIWLFLFAVPYCIIWLRQKNTMIPSIIGIIFGVFMLVRFPASAYAPALLILALSIAGGLIPLFARFQNR